MKKTNEIESNLNYLNLDLNDIPEILLKKMESEMLPARNYEEKKFKVYKYVPISKINILLTRANRLNTIQEKWKMAAPLHAYLVPEDEEGILRHTNFLNMIKNMNTDEINTIEKEQESLKEEIPFKVKYNENYLWQIYYSEYSKNYYMLAPIEDLDYSCLFYLIKEQIEYSKTNKDKEIFVPISYLDYSRKYFIKSQIADIEKYLWQFTKNWPLMYEVYDKEDNMSFQIVGNTEVYEKINSVYKIKLNTEEEATKFYKLIKALFILETEFPNRYRFDVKIAENGGLEFLFNSKVIDYDSLTKFIKEEFLKNKVEYESQNQDIIKLNSRLDELKLVENDKEEEYRMRQKQVAMYLQCRKSFFGRIRYYFRGKKDIRNLKNREAMTIVKEIKQVEQDQTYDTKEYYTIEDLIGITKILDRVINEIRNINSDIKAKEISIDRLNKRAQNAKRYIDEIEEHKKSIFEFWSFVNKDNVLALNEGENEEVKHQEIEKTFDYEEDIEDLGKKLDKKNRETFSKEEFDSLFIASTETLTDINALRNSGENDFSNSIKNLKEEALKTEILFTSEDFDIFGGMSEDKTKISILGNTKHREIKKNKFKILDITKNTKNEQYIERLEEIRKTLDKAIDKSKFGIKLNAFYTSTVPLNNTDYNILYINPQNAIEEIKEHDKINLYCIKLHENSKAIALTNIAYYDNTNRTLPVGMDISDKIIVDMSKLKLELKKQKLFRINQEIDELNVKTKIICVYEYEVAES